jgi:N-acetylglutamate synthase-like GNAT family acetyltransferase
MNVIIHKNNWPWGRDDIIVIAGGRGLCTVSIEDDNPAVAYLSGVSVCESSRHMGLGNELLELSKQHAREMGAKMLCLWAYPEQWVVDWYKRRGFTQQCVYDDKMVGLTFDLE